MISLSGVVGQILPLTNCAFWSDYLRGETTDVVGTVRMLRSFLQDSHGSR